MSGQGRHQRQLEDLMGGTASVTITTAEGHDDADALLDAAECLLRDLHQRWTRFDRDSELMQLNAAAGAAVPVSSPTRALVRAMVDAWRCTDGAVDASALPQVVENGYGVSTVHRAASTQVPPGARRVGLGDVVIDDVAGTVELPPRVAVDAGGLGKGLAADLAVDHLIAAGCAGALVEISGDLRARGRACGGADWSIAIEDPFRPGSHLAHFGLGAGGVATSSVLKRRWDNLDGSTSHHLIGRDGRSAWHGITTCTVIASSGVAAEVFAKLPLLVGLDEGLPRLEEWRIPAYLMLDDGSALATQAWTQEAA